MGVSQLSQLVAVQSVSAVRAVQALKLRSKNTVNHMNTNTTIQTQSAADQASLELKIIIEKINKDFSRGISFQDVRNIYKEKAGSIIAATIRTTFLLGHGFIEQYAGRTITLSLPMVQKMNTEIENTITAFWNQIEKLHNNDQVKQMTKIVGAAGETPLITLLLNYAASLASSMSFRSLNVGTVSARQEQFRMDQFRTSISVSATRNGIPVDTVPNSYRQADPSGRPSFAAAVPALLLWVSERDSKVCPICLNLDGRTFDANDPLIPYPITDTHFGCRCRLLPLQDGKAFNA
jgi:hypothetical protein